MPISVVLEPYNLEWPRMAQAHVDRLQVLGSNLVTVHHIGSTSVPGLVAKPIIDLIPVVRDIAELDRQQELVEALGYVWMGEFGIPTRRYCRLDDESGTRISQLHIFETGSPHIDRHLAFRDYLRAHPSFAVEYAAEKHRARALHPDNSHDYTDEKSAWVVAHEAEALAWYRGSG